MALVVKHNSTADGDPLIDGDDWNANHTLTGGGTFRLPKLIESKSLTSSTGGTFSSLNGDSDVEYLLVFDYTISGSTDYYVYLLPGGATAGDFDAAEHQPGGVANLDDKGFILTPDVWARGHIWGTLTIQAKTGSIRASMGFRDVVVDATNHTSNVSYSTWSDTSTNITSLVLGIESGGSMTGTFDLYRMVDLTI